MLINPSQSNKRTGYVSNVLDAKSKGWVRIESTTLGLKFLCYQTEVQVLDSTKNAEVLKIEEGFFKGHTVICPFYNQSENVAWSYIASDKRRKPAAKLTYDSNYKILDVDNLGKFSVASDEDALQKGLYDIAIPAYPHKKPSITRYLDESIGGSRFAETWFKLIPKDRKREGQFIHFGSYSRGCITVLSDWTKLYLHLIVSRKDDQSIGTLLVK